MGVIPLGVIFECDLGCTGLTWLYFTRNESNHKLINVATRSS